MPLVCSLRASDEEAGNVRVIDCDVCGATINAANDDELAGELDRHMRSEHPDTEWDDERAGELVSSQAYSATDS
jgi:predicted small metal-binding protein